MPMLHNHRVLYIIACQKWDHNYMYVNVFCTHSLAKVLTKCHDFYDDLKLSTSLAAGEWWSNWSFPQLFGSWHWHPEAFMKPPKTKLEPSGTPNFGVEQVSGYCLAHGVRKKQLSLAQSQSFVIGCNRCCKAQNGNYFRWCRCCTPPAWKRIRVSICFNSFQGLAMAVPVSSAGCGLSQRQLKGKLRNETLLWQEPLASLGLRND